MVSDYFREPVREAFESEVKNNYKYYLNFTRRFAIREGIFDYEDLLQDTLFSFWRCCIEKKGMPQNQDEFRKLFVNKMKQIRIDYFRYNRLAFRSGFISLDNLVDMEDSNNFGYDFDNPAQNTERKERDEIFHKILNDLIERTSFSVAKTVLLKFSGLSYNKVACIQNIRESTARWRYYIFCNRLANRLEKNEAFANV